MFGFGQKKKMEEEVAAKAHRFIKLFAETSIRQEGAFVTLRRLVESGVISQDALATVWSKADKERRKVWRQKNPGDEFLGPLNIDAIFDADDDDL
jgi:hypothetical protein